MSNDQPSPTFISLKELASEFGISVSTLRRRLASRKEEFLHCHLHCHLHSPAEADEIRAFLGAPRKFSIDSRQPTAKI